MTITKTPQELEAELWTRINAGEMTPDEAEQTYRDFTESGEGRWGWGWER